jgi:hypothetical protein
MQNKNEIIEILESLKITNYIINNDLIVDVNGNVNLFDRQLTEIPVKFGIVNGAFICDYNNLKSLKNAPMISNDFYCVNCGLTSLESATMIVKGKFYCQFNKLTTLNGAPKEVGGDFNCSHNKLTTLENGPIIVQGWYACHYNNLISLKGISKLIKGKTLNISNNEDLNSLEGLDLIKNKHLQINYKNTKITPTHRKKHKIKQHCINLINSKKLIKKL